MDTETDLHWPSPHNPATSTDVDEPGDIPTTWTETSADEASAAIHEVQPGRATHRQPLGLGDLAKQLAKSRGPFVSSRRLPPNPDLIVHKQVTNDDPQGNAAPARRGTDTYPAPAHDRLPDGRSLPGQEPAVVTVHTWEEPSESFLPFSQPISSTVAQRILGRDPARRSAVLVNTDAAIVISLGASQETTTPGGTATFPLVAGAGLKVSSRDEVWAIAASGAPIMGVAIETG